MNLMKVRLLSTPYGAYSARPLSPRRARPFAKHMEEMGHPASAEAFFQGDYELPEEVTKNKRAMRNLQTWGCADILVDPWIFGHWLGWDAHTVAE